MRLRLATLPTPLQRLHRYSERCGQDVWIKRDDLTGSVLSGNKVRKLEYLLGDAIAKGYSSIVTCGGWNSNHARASAFAARAVGLKPYLVLRTEDGTPRYEGNALLCAMAAEDIAWVDREQHKRFKESLVTDPDSFVQYPIPLGGSNGIGALGYARMVQDELPRRFDHIVHAMGSGGTGAGLALGKRRSGASWDIHGYTVGDTADEMRIEVERIAKELCEAPFEMRIEDSHRGPAYGVPYLEQMELMRWLARNEGVLLDPTYTGKAFAGMDADIREGTLKGSIVFLHTGGSFGNFGVPAWAEFLTR